MCHRVAEYVVGNSNMNSYLLHSLLKEFLFPSHPAVGCMVNN
uniref:Uncharacterized protein n=1 Tax=Anguilla anguilla TaxID=7936 RepID=A0A0E9SC74_ANGAN